MSGAKRITIGAGLTLLVLVIGLAVVGASQPLQNHFQGSVRDLLPMPPPGWSQVERPIADSPEMQKAVGQILNFDDAVFVDFISPTGPRLSVYIAYWKAGKMLSREVAAHTPDVCWVGNGWERESDAVVKVWGRDQQAIAAGASRVFSLGNATENVLFWHLVDGESLSYGRQGPPPWYAALLDVLRKGLSQRHEQFFVRLSSPEPLDGESLRPLMDPLISQVRTLAPESVRAVGPQ